MDCLGEESVTQAWYCLECEAKRRGHVYESEDAAEIEKQIVSQADRWMAELGEALAGLTERPATPRFSPMAPQAKSSGSGDPDTCNHVLPIDTEGGVYAYKARALYACEFD